MGIATHLDRVPLKGYSIVDFQPEHAIHGTWEWIG